MVDINSDNRIDFRAAVNFFAERKVCLQPQRLHIRLPNAKEVLDAGLRHFLGCNYMWQPEYDKVVDWLTDNKGLGLFCMGNCGRGKTTICLQILPCIIQHYFHKVFSICLAREMNRHYTEVMRSHLLVIDDIGREEPIRRTLVNVKWLIISYLTFLFCKNWRNFGVLIVTLCIITFFFVMMIVHQLKV